MADDIKDDDAVVEPNFMTMSDDDIANFDTQTMSLPDSSGDADNKGDQGKAVVDAGKVEESDEDKAATAAAAAALDDDKGAGDEGAQGKSDKTNDVGSGTPDASGKTDPAPAGKDGKVADPKAAAADGKKEVDGDGKAKSGDEGAKDESDAGAVVDYKAAYEELLAPFKANGKDMQVKSVADAKALMQMGANYNKKMAGLKPSLKLLKMLETNGLLDEEQIGFLIDVHKRDPAAINKLIVDSKMDPLDLSAAKAQEYKPGNHSIDDTSMELDEVLETIKGSKDYARTLDVVANQWDKSSRTVIADNPGVISLINSHMAAGIYDVIMAEVENERMVGRLKGLSDIHAYKQVGDAIQARGGFDHLTGGNTQTQGKPAATAPVVVTPKPKQADDEKLKAQRKAASGTKAAAPGKTGVPADFNPLSMSDDDFAKFK